MKKIISIQQMTESKILYDFVEGKVDLSKLKRRKGKGIFRVAVFYTSQLFFSP